MSMQLPKPVWDVYAQVANKFADMHRSQNDDDRREAHKRGVQTIRARVEGGDRFVCKTEHNTGWAAASKDALAYVSPDFGPVEHMRMSKMHMFDMINGGSRTVNGYPLSSHNFEETPPNEEAYILIPEPFDWLADTNPQPTEPSQPTEPTQPSEPTQPTAPAVDLTATNELLSAILAEQKTTNERLDAQRKSVEAAAKQIVRALAGGLFGTKKTSKAKK